MADFPTTKKTWVDLVDNVSPANSSDINSAYAEITAIEDAFLTDSTSLDASTDIHGFLPKLSGSSDEYINGIGEWGTPAGGASSSDLIEHTHTGTTDGGLIRLDTISAPTDVTTLNSSTDTHGLLPKLNGTSDNYLNGKGEWGAVVSTPSTDIVEHAHTTSDTGGLIKLDTISAPTDVTTLNASTDAHGLLPKLDGTSDNYLNGKGEWWNVPVASATVPGKVYLSATSDVLSGASDQIRVITSDLLKQALAVDSTDLDASASSHGFLPKLNGTSDNYLNGKGEWWNVPAASATEAGKVYLAATSDVLSGTSDQNRVITSDLLKQAMAVDSTDLDASASSHGFLPKLDGTSDNYLNGKGEWWNVPVATTLVPGKVYLAATSDINAGTSDLDRAITSDKFAESNYSIRFVYAPLNGSTALASGDKVYFPIPAEMTGWNLVQARATCGANSSSDATVFTVKKGGGTQTLLSTNIMIDPTLTDSLASSDQPVISSSDNPVTSTDIIEVAATSDCGAGMTYAGVLTGWQLL